MIEVPLFQAIVVLLMVIGLITALVFLTQHRPRQRFRMASLTVTGWVWIVVLFYLRQLGLLIFRWPGAPPQGLGDLLWSLGFLVLIDALLIGQLLTYRDFASHDRDRQHERLSPHEEGK